MRRAPCVIFNLPKSIDIFTNNLGVAVAPKKNQAYIIQVTSGGIAQMGAV